MARKHALLVAPGEPRIKRQHLEARAEGLLDRLGGIAYLALARQEHQHVALPDFARFRAEFVERRDDAGRQARIEAVIDVRIERPEACLDRVAAPRDLEHRRAAEVAGEALRVDRRGGNEELQVRPARQHALEDAEQKIDVERALVRFVDDDCVVAPVERILARLGEQDAVGHQLDRGRGTRAVGEADLEADEAGGRAGHLLGEPGRDRARGDAPRLRVANDPTPECARLEQHLRQLRGLARARLAADDEHLVRFQRRDDLLAARHDRELRRIAERRKP